MDTSIRILLVEDSLIAQKITSLYMKSQGCRVDIAADATSALKKTAKTHYHLILMDIGLGNGPDGFEVASQIKQQGDLNNTTPIMLITSYDQPTYQEKAMQCDIMGYFNKPFTETEAKIVMHTLKNLMH